MAVRKVVQPAVEEAPKEALWVVVYRRWWQQDEFYNEGQIGVNINSGVLTIEIPNEIHSYAPGRWRKVVSTHLNPPPAPPAPPQPEQHEH